MKKSFLLTAILTLVTACATPRSQTPDDEFETTISKDGSKRFVYTLDFSRLPTLQPKKPSINNPTRHRDPDESNQSELDRYEVIMQLMQLGLEKKIHKTEYCKEGYLILEERVKAESSYIRGECKDGVNDN